ncbi:hypothetical protein NQ314_007780 [Rhamnusium bicolor]|uniref:Uncharacterized protein n=1 Tax=Rhamnusium bicolor TaxID=1586634 RepID=A0AAV8YGD6_9CUCU|nr:hypothetical protein NQ314_007780 [Rhamnusium bicolor]
MTDLSSEFDNGVDVKAMINEENVPLTLEIKEDAVDETKLNDVAELQCRIGKFEPIYDDFNIVQSELESKLMDISDTEEQERTQFEDDYFLYIGKARCMLNKFSHIVQRGRHVTAEPTLLDRTGNAGVVVETYDGSFNSKLEPWAAAKTNVAAITEKMFARRAFVKT